MHKFALNSREALGLPSSTLHRLDRGDKLPLGIPQLMMAFTADRQAKANIIAERDKLYTASAAKRQSAPIFRTRRSILARTPGKKGRRSSSI